MATETKLPHPEFGHVLFHNLSPRQLEVIDLLILDEEISRKAFKLLNGNYGVMVEDIETLKEMIVSLIDELEGNFKTDYTFKLIENASKLVKTK